MSELFKIVLSLSLSGTLLFFIILALKQFYKNKLSKQWQYYIWLIVVARMLLPFTPETTLVGSAFEYFGNINGEVSQTIPFINNIQGDLGLEDDYIMPSANQQEGKVNPLSSPAIYPVFLKIYENLWILWAAIAFALLVRKITMYQSFIRFVKAGRVEVWDIEILNILADVGEMIGVKKPVELFINPLISSPMLLGFFRPCIILPSIEFEKNQLSYIMRHELTHYKNLDMFYKWLVQIMVCVHWFNPFAYLLAKEINKGCELSCDERIIRTLDKDEKKLYGDTLLNSLKTMGHYNDKLATVSLTEGGEQLKERLEAIMKFKRGSKITVIIMLMLTFVLVAGATVVGAYAKPTNKTPASSWSVMGKSYIYSQQGYYQAPYIFVIGRNLNENGVKAYLNKANITLFDKSDLTVYFDASCKEYAKDTKALAAIKTLLEKLTKQYANSSLPIEKPLVVSVKYVGNKDLNKLAEEYYTNNEITSFSAILPALKVNLQKIYWDKMYANGKIAFFAATLNCMDADMLNYYAEKAFADNKVNFFSTIVPFLSDEAKDTWIAKSAKDKKNGFLAILTQQTSKSQSIQNSGILPDKTKELAISFDIDNGGVKILPATSKEIKASYDSEYYSVSIGNINGKWVVNVTGKLAMMGKTDHVLVYIPDIKCTIDADVLNGNFSYALPDDCENKISISAKNAGVDFTSKNQYKNSKISLIATNNDFIKYEPPVYPSYFSKTNSGLEYTNGTGKNQISIKLTGYTSVNFLETSTSNLSYQPDTSGK